MIDFVDSASPERIPSGAFQYAAAYRNGFTWPKAQAERFGHNLFWISVLPEAYWARLARCIDVERGAAAPSDVPAFIRERERLGFTDATVYCSKDTLPAVEAAAEGLAYRRWIADWVDTKPVSVPAGWWAWQWSTNGFDQSLTAQPYHN